MLKHVADLPLAGRHVLRRRRVEQAPLADRDVPGVGPDQAGEARSSVVLPDPDSPNRIVMPGGAENETSSVNAGESRFRTVTARVRATACT